MILRAFLLFFLGLLSHGFAQRPADQSQYLRLREGDEWTLDVKIISPKGEVTNATGRRFMGKPVEKNGKTYYPARTWMVFSPIAVDYTILVRKDSKGFYMLDERQKGAKEELLIGLPFKVGQSWERKAESGTMITTVLGVEKVVIGGKTYENCYHLQSKRSDGRFTEDSWEAPRMGIVKSEEVYASGGKMIATLREFIPAK